MICVCQHIPGYMDGIEPFRADVASQEHLLALPWVALYADGRIVARDGEVRRQPFFRFSLSDHSLMAEFDEGRTWLVIANIRREDVSRLTLPKWTPHPDGDKRVAEWNKGNTSYGDGRFQHWPLVPRASAQGDGAGE